MSPEPYDTRAEPDATVPDVAAAADWILARRS